MSASEEREPKKQRPDEYAPPIAWEGSSHVLNVHHSDLQPDPQATIDLRTWTRLYYQATHVDSSQSWALVKADTTAGPIVIQLPYDYDYDNDPDSIPWSVASDENIMDEDGSIVAKRWTNIEFDSLRPGFAIVREQYYGEPDHRVPAPVYGPEDQAIEVNSGTHYNPDNSTLRYRETTHHLTQQQALDLEGVLGSASWVPDDSEFMVRLAKGMTLEEALTEEGLPGYDHIFDEMDLMSPAMRALTQRVYIDGKPLFTKPEEALLTKAHWGLDYRSAGLVINTEHGHKLMCMISPDCLAYRGNLQERLTNESGIKYDRTQSLWAVETWFDSEITSDPDDRDPHEVHLATLKEVLDGAPKEVIDAVDYDTRYSLFLQNNVVQATYEILEKTLQTDDLYGLATSFYRNDFNKSADEIIKEFKAREVRYASQLAQAIEALPESFEQNPPKDTPTPLEVTGCETHVCKDVWGGLDPEKFYDMIRRLHPAA